MKYFKDNENKLHFINEGFEYLIPHGLTEIGESEYLELISPKPPTNEELISKLQSELNAIERAEIMPRKTREIQIELMEFLAVQQGITPQQLALNPAYAGMKEVDAKCEELRAQIRALS